MTTLDPVCPGSEQSDWKDGTNHAGSAECSYCGHRVPLRYIGWWASAMPAEVHLYDGQRQKEAG